MAERTITDYRAHLDLTLQKLVNPGLLLVVPEIQRELPNAMTIGWATFGVIWGRPICAVLVRPSRYTYSLMEHAQEFTVCVPGAGMEKQVSFCGTVSGRDHDKFREMGFTIQPSTAISAPGIAECPVIYECRTVHTNDLIPANLDQAIKNSSYPQGDFHRIYYGNILATTANL